MKPRGIEQAFGKLNLCRRALDAMQASITNQLEFQTHWHDFLVQWKGAYSKVQQAAKETPQELQWFGAVSSERRGDPLLRYLFEARNDGEHGLNQSALHGADHFELRTDRTGEVTIVDLRPVSIDRMEAIGVDGSVVAEAVRTKPSEISLGEVTERDGNTKVSPPTSHLGQTIEPTPVVVAELGLRWLESLVNVAHAMIGPMPSP